MHYIVNSFIYLTIIKLLCISVRASIILSFYTCSSRIIFTGGPTVDVRQFELVRFGAPLALRLVAVCVAPPVCVVLTRRVRQVYVVT